MRRILQTTHGSLVLVLGVAVMLVAIFATPTFVASYFSRDQSLEVSTIEQLNGCRRISFFAGALFTISGSILISVKNLGERFLQRVNSIASKTKNVNGVFERLFESKILKGILILTILCFLLLRFVNLNADFPSGITVSGELYTDEGWYVSAAVRHFLTGQWYQAGEVNTALAAPVGHILQRISLQILGLGLSSARITTSISFALLTVLTALLVRRNFGNTAALLTALLLATNYLGFAYSRLGTPYLIAISFFMAGFFVAGGLNGRSNLSRIVAGSILVSIAMLTHGTAVVAIPLLIFLAWFGGSSLKEHILFLLVSGFIVAILAGGNRFITNMLFPEDYILYNSSTVGHIYTTFADWEWGLFHKLPVRVLSIGPNLVKWTLLFAALAFALSKKFRKDPLAHFFITYIAVYVGMLSLSAYSAPRYLLVLLVPFSGLFAIASSSLVEWLREVRWSAAALVPIIFVMGIVWNEGTQVINYLSKPSFSFYQMTHAVENIIQQREGSARGVMLFGDIADSVSIEIGTNAINSLLIGDNLEEKINRVHPKYMIVHTSNIVEIATSLGGKVTELGAWDVLGNYYANHEQIRLYLIEWPGDTGQ